MSLGENIKSIRERQYITLEQFSHMTGIAIENCEKIEAGKRALSSAEIQSICRVLNVSFEELVTATVPAPDPESAEGSVVMPVDELQKLLGKMRE